KRFQRSSVSSAPSSGLKVRSQAASAGAGADTVPSAAARIRAGSAIPALNATRRLNLIISSSQSSPHGLPLWASCTRLFVSRGVFMIAATDVTRSDANPGRRVENVHKVGPRPHAYDLARREVVALAEDGRDRSEEHTSELQSRENLVC